MCGIFTMATNKVGKEPASHLTRIKEKDINFTIHYVGGKNMPHVEYQKQDLINMIHHLQAKVNFYKQQFEEMKQREIYAQDLQERIKLGTYENNELHEEIAKLKNENDLLIEEIKSLQNKESYDSVFIKSQQMLQKGKQTKQFKAEAPNLDPWFIRNLKENNRVEKE